MKIKYLFLIAVAGLLCGMGCSVPVFDEEQWEKRVESVDIEQLYQPHEKDGVFFTPWISRDLSFLGVVRWWFTPGQKYSAEEESHLPNQVPDTVEWIESLRDKDFIVWIGHDSFLIKLGEMVWLTDPIFSKRALLPARVTPPALTAKDINLLFPNARVLISHNHYDHLDEPSIRQLSPNYTYIVPKGMKETIKGWQPTSDIVEMDWWQSIELGEGHQIHCLPAQHWSRRAFVETNASLWASYLLISPEINVYFGGDSGYFIGYREIGRKFKKIDYALLPTTAYHPRWRMHVSHMNVKEAIKAFGELGATYFIPTQWGTFRLGDNPPGHPALDLRRFIAENNLDEERIKILDLGQVLRLKNTDINTTATANK